MPGRRRSPRIVSAPSSTTRIPVAASSAAGAAAPGSAGPAKRRVNSRAVSGSPLSSQSVRQSLCTTTTRPRDTRANSPATAAGRDNHSHVSCISTEGKVPAAKGSRDASPAIRAKPAGPRHSPTSRRSSATPPMPVPATVAARAAPSPEPTSSSGPAARPVRPAASRS